MIGRKPCRFLVDTGAMISVIKNGICKKKIRPTQITAKSATGNKLKVYGEQKIGLNIGEHCQVYHDFLVADLQTTYDGLLGVDLLKKLGVKIDFASGDIYAEGVALNAKHESENEEPSAGKAKHGQLTFPAGNNISPTLTSTKRTWCVLTDKNQSIPPMSELIVWGRLNNTDQFHSGKHSNEVVDCENVLIEPVNLNIYGLKVARVLSKVRHNVVTIKLVNFSKEALEIPKRSLLGIAESLDTLLPNDDVTVKRSKDKDINVVNRFENKKSSANNVSNEIRDKLKHLSKQEYRVLWPVFQKYMRIFDEPKSAIGCKNKVRHKIDTGDHPPIRKNPYRLPHALKSVVNEQISDMQNKGIVRPSDSPWASPVVIVSKKSPDGSPKYRFCVDYRALNTITRKDAYPLPNIVETLDALSGSEYFTTLDLCSGYHQVDVEPSDIEKTAFSVPGQHYEFTKMPFGLCNAPATFQRLMDSMLVGIKGEEALVYLDDIIIFSKNIEQHATRLGRVLQILYESNLYVQLSKCNFAVREVEYLGHIVSNEGIKPDHKKIDAIANYPKPQNIRDVRSFLGLVGYYRRFIKDFAQKAKPLTELIKKDKPFKWEEAQEEAYKFFTTALCTEPVLKYPDFSKPFVLSTDASNTAIGAVLSQVHHGQEHPIAYASRQLNKAESNYSTTEKELLALIWATKYFRCYLYGRKFTAVTDHAALRWMLSLKDPSSRLTRWALRLSEFDYEVVHKPGRKHANADALSRHVNVIATPLISRQEISREQQQDEFCLKHIRQTGNGYKINEDGLLYNIEQETPRLVIPRALVSQIISNHHDTIFSGHQGVKRTLGIIRGRFYWPTMVKDIEEYVGKCISCSQRKPGSRNLAPLGKISPVTEPFELVSLDIVGPLPVSRNGNKYLLTFIDYLTRYCEAIPIPNQTAEVIAHEFVTKIITRYGVPKRLLTDQGRNFVSTLFKSTCTLIGVKKIQTTPYHPQCNGMIERLHKSLADMISHFVAADGKNWDEVLPYALMAYRSAPHSLTGYSPYMLLFGREMRLPTLDNLSETNQLDESVQFELEVLQDKLNQVRTQAIQNSEKHKQKYKEHYDKKQRFKAYTIGDFVYLHDPTSKRGPRRKFAKTWKGPFEIIEVISDFNYKIRLKNGEQLIVHFNRLKHSKTKDSKPRRAVKPLSQSDNATHAFDTASTSDLKRGNSCELSDSIISTPTTSQIYSPLVIPVNELPIENEETDTSSILPVTETSEDRTSPEQTQLNETVGDLNDAEWEPPRIGTNALVQSDYNLRPRDRIVAPRRFLDE